MGSLIQGTGTTHATTHPPTDRAHMPPAPARHAKSAGGIAATAKHAPPACTSGPQTVVVAHAKHVAQVAGPDSALGMLSPRMRRTRTKAINFKPLVGWRLG